MSITLEMKIILFSGAVLILFMMYYGALKYPRLNRVLGILGGIYGLIYILWRFFYTLPFTEIIGLAFGILLVTFETLAYGQSLVFKLLFSSQKELDWKRERVFEEYPTVDIIVSTYNESEDILKRTLIGCMNIDYPKEKLTVYIGDDGKREEIRILAQTLGVNYVTRMNNAHAKAGNINNVMDKSQGEFVLLLDADMIPKSNIVQSLLVYFEDNRTGFVQSPQVFYNLDPFQYNLDVGEAIPNEQDFFMRTVQGKRSLYNAVLHVGTNALFRRQAIEAIGGIPIGSITEDMATGMLLQDSGYKSFFVAETLAVGLSVEGIEDLIKQRDRWLRGNIQVIKRYNPIFMKGLNIIQKIIYLDGFVYWMYGLQKMIYIIAPLLYLLFRIRVFDADAFDIVFMFMPYFISNSLYFRRISDKSRNVTWSHIYDTAIAPQMALSFLTEFFLGRKIAFNVTPKGVVSYRDHFRIRLAKIHIFLMVISVLALIMNGYLWMIGQPLGPKNALIINIGWCIYNGLAIFISIFIYIDKKRFRRSERIPTQLKADVLITECDFGKECGCCGYVMDISENGARIEVQSGCKHFEYHEQDVINIDIESIGVVKCLVRRVIHANSKIIMGVSFENIGFDTFSKINQYRFNINNKYVRDYTIDRKMDGMFEIIYKILTSWKYGLRKSKK